MPLQIGIRYMSMSRQMTINGSPSQRCKQSKSLAQENIQPFASNCVLSEVMIMHSQARDPRAHMCRCSKLAGQQPKHAATLWWMIASILKGSIL